MIALFWLVVVLPTPPVCITGGIVPPFVTIPFCIPAIPLDISPFCIPAIAFVIIPFCIPAVAVCIEYRVYHDHFSDGTQEVVRNVVVGSSGSSDSGK